jgi:hypothetical protein
VQVVPTALDTWNTICAAPDYLHVGDVTTEPPVLSSVVCCPAVAPVMDTCQWLGQSTYTSSGINCPAGQFALNGGVDCANNAAVTSWAATSIGSHGFPLGIQGNCDPSNDPHSVRLICCDLPTVADNALPLCTQISGQGSQLSCPVNTIMLLPSVNWSRAQP